LFGIGGMELAIILIFGFLIFGPDKLPQVAKTVVRFVQQFRSAQEQMTEVIKKEVVEPMKDLEPLVNPFSGIDLSLDDSKKKEDVEKGAPSSAGKSSGAAGAAAVTKPVAAAAASAAVSTKPVAATAAAPASTSKSDAATRAAVSSPKPSFAERRAAMEREMQADKAAGESGEDT
jgi:TatA/E family protein of Tat protein translocase